MQRMRKYPAFAEDQAPASHPGRARFGTYCPEAERCMEWASCRNTYNEDHREKDDCPHFKPYPAASASRSRPRTPNPDAS